MEEIIKLEPRLAGSKMAIKRGNRFYFSPAMFHLYTLEEGKDLEFFLKRLSFIRVETVIGYEDAIKKLTGAKESVIIQ